MDEVVMIEPTSFKSDRQIGFLRSCRGNTAVEFTLVLIPLILLTIGTINLGLMMYTASALHYAVEDAARCSSVKTLICSDPASTAAYAATRYRSVGGTVTFTRTTAACGNQVQGVANYRFVTGLSVIIVPMSATACYPLA
jgi:Flp pilus assembly protein TadG